MATSKARSTGARFVIGEVTHVRATRILNKSKITAMLLTRGFVHLILKVLEPSIDFIWTADCANCGPVLNIAWVRTGLIQSCESAWSKWLQWEEYTKYGDSVYRGRRRYCQSNGCLFEERFIDYCCEDVVNSCSSDPMPLCPKTYSSVFS